jgi:hypothetical protein
MGILRDFFEQLWDYLYFRDLWKKTNSPSAYLLSAVLLVGIIVFFVRHASDFRLFH